MKRTTIMADEGTLLELKAIAQRQGKSTSQVIREALAEYVVSHRTEGQQKNPLLALEVCCLIGRDLVSRISGVRPEPC
jgi:metal-responsive CopG/Arc/MetJ family transcriptional regulator